MSMPEQNRGSSRQDYETPDDLIEAVTLRFGEIGFDLAATRENSKGKRCLTPETDSLKAMWQIYDGEIAWLNPPFADINPWAAKCAETAVELSGGSRILLLVPASIGSEWFRANVHGKAFVHALNPRLTFKGCTSPYPKDCLLAEYGASPGFDVWRWKEPAARRRKVAA